MVTDGTWDVGLQKDINSTHKVGPKPSFFFLQSLIRLINKVLEKKAGILMERIRANALLFYI